MLTIQLTRDGHKNVVWVVTGKGIAKKGVSQTVQITDKDCLKPKPPTGLRLDSVEFSIEGGTKCFLEWEEEKQYILPLEGRGKLDFNWFDGIRGDDIRLTVEGEGAVFIVLDLSKIGV